MLNDDFNEEKYRITKDELRELSGVNYNDQTAEKKIDDMWKLCVSIIEFNLNKNEK